MKALVNKNKKKIEEGNYFSADKILKEHIIEKDKYMALTINKVHGGITTGMTVECKKCRATVT